MGREQQCRGDRRGSLLLSAVMMSNRVILGERRRQRVNEQDIDDVDNEIRQMKSERAGASPDRVIDRVRQVDQRAGIRDRESRAS